jgi:hypothetical protein
VWDSVAAAVAEQKRSDSLKKVAVAIKSAQQLSVNSSD